ncbi:phosphoribosyltransferase [Aggregatilinea lenta]|uniref:phosphoribosyltransferase n=1 Tax=Aggregatilinea lenta TaxID=913108 RepID=UPI000E5B5890|nr:phosphoribosyltransferase family protein [Aggregatilinea lenta]
MSSSYDYSARQGIYPISWEDFHGLCKALALAAAAFNPAIILGVGRGGYYPATLIAHLLQAELYPVRLSRRVNDVVVHERPQWIVRPPETVRDQRVLVVDEISSTGETLALVKSEALRLGAADVRCAVLYAHTWGAAIPDAIGLITDALILNPWDREILRDGAFHFHPEYVEALAQQDVTPSPDLLIPATPVGALAKDTLRT